MKPATQILTALVGALGGFFVWALFKRTKELVYALVKAKYVLIILALAAWATVEILGWHRVKEFLLSVGYVVGLVLVSIVALILSIAGIVQLVRYLRSRALMTPQPEPVVETERDQL